MNFEPKDQKSALDEIMEKINAIQHETQVVESSKKLIEKRNGTEESEESSDFTIDESVFDQIKGEKQNISNPKEKSVIRRLIDGEEDENDEQDEPPARSAIYDDDPEDIEDFEAEEDRDEIYRDLKNIVGKMAVKMVFLFLLSMVSLYLFIAGFHPVLFGGDADSVWFDIAFLAVDILCIIVSFGIFAQGLIRLLRARADTDALLALLAIALVVVRVAGLINPNLFQYNLNFEPMLALGLYFNVVAKKKIAANIKKNFKFIASSGDKLTVSVPSSCESNNDLILETGEGGEIMYAHPTGLVTKYIEHSYSDFDWDRKFQHLWFILLLVIVAGTIAVSQLAGWGEALLFPAASLALSVPLFSRYYYASSIAKNGKKMRRNGGILTSAQSAKELEDADLLVIKEEDFLGKDAVLLQGVKAMGDTQIDDLITNIAALFNCVGTPLKPLFLKMIDLNSVTLPRVDDIYYHEGMGYSCLIHSKMFLVGNRKLMEQFNINFQKPLMEMQLKDCRFPVYVAYQKLPAGIFIASYERNKHTEAAVHLAEDERVSVGIVSNDFLFDKNLLQRMYPMEQPELFHFISPRTGAACRSLLERRENSPDLIGSITGPRGLMACLYGASKLLTALKINSIIRILYSILALALIFFIALAGYSANTALQILAFQAIWLIPVCAICIFCK